MNWIGILAISVTVTLTVGGALLRWLISNNKEIAELRLSVAQLEARVAESYVKRPEIEKLEGMLASMRTELLASIARAAQDFSNQVGPLRNEVSGLSKVVNQMVGSMNKASHITE